MDRRRIAVVLASGLLIGTLQPRSAHPMPTASAAPLGQEVPAAVDPALKEQADRLSAEGEALLRQGDFRGALARLEQALPLYRRAGDRAGEAQTLGNIGFLYGQRLGDDARALEHYELALPILRDLGEDAAEAQTLDNLGRAADRLGQSARALEAYEQALALRRALRDRAGEGLILNNIGTVYHRLGEYGRALELFEEALAIAREVRDRRGEGIVLHNIGTIHDSRGEDARALERYLEALPIRAAVRDRAGEAATLHRIGAVYARLAQYSRTLEAYERALEIRRELGDRAGQAALLNNIGLAHERLDQLPGALESYTAALEIVRELEDREGEGRLLSNVGLLAQRRGEYELALDLYRSALAIVRARDDRAGEAAILNNIGEAYAGQRQYGRALEAYEAALAGARVVGNRSGEARTLANMGLAHESLGAPEQALAWYTRSLDVSEAVRAAASLEEFKTSLAERSVIVYQRTISLLMGRGDHAAAFELSERARARTFLDQLGNARLELRPAADAGLAEEEQALRLDIAGLERELGQESSRALDQAFSRQQREESQARLREQLEGKQREYEALLTRLKLANPEYVSLVSVPTLSLADLQNLLERDTTLVSYFVMSDTTLAFVVTRDAFQAVPLAVGERELADAIPAGAAPLGDDLALLHGWLVAPLRPYLATPVVGVVPHGVLHQLPFAALTDGGRSLGDEHALFALPSASILPFIGQKRKDPGGPVLALAQARAEGLPTLRHADQEAGAVATLYGTEATVGTAATEAAFRARAGEHAVIHVAAHGELNATSPLFSRVVLAPGGGEDGSLYVHEVYGLDLARADLVVLSACQTDRGARGRGDDVVGLTRAFVYAGAPTVVASLWNVDDEATAELMTAFYGHLKQELGKAEALQAAQAELRTQPRYADPYYWAAFVLTGDPGTGMRH